MIIVLMAVSLLVGSMLVLWHDCLPIAFMLGYLGVGFLVGYWYVQGREEWNAGEANAVTLFWPVAVLDLIWWKVIRRRAYLRHLARRAEEKRNWHARWLETQPKEELFVWDSSELTRGARFTSEGGFSEN